MTDENQSRKTLEEIEAILENKTPPKSIYEQLEEEGIEL